MMECYHWIFEFDYQHYNDIQSKSYDIREHELDNE